LKLCKGGEGAKKKGWSGTDNDDAKQRGKKEVTYKMRGKRGEKRS